MASNCTPSKSFFMMKLTTPPIASDPYAADAPPVSTSTRSTIAAGIWFRSGAADAVVTPPYGMRRPSTSTSVRGEPRPRRLTVAVPVAPFETLAFCAAKACGSWLIEVFDSRHALHRDVIRRDLRDRAGGLEIRLTRCANR